MNDSPNLHIVVVGGGLAGLAATVWLAELGYAVTLLESNGSLGGRTIGLTSGHGDAIENGQHVFAGSYDCVFRYLDSVGTRHLCGSPTNSGCAIRAGTSRRSVCGPVTRAACCWAGSAVWVCRRC